MATLPDGLNRDPALLRAVLDATRLLVLVVDGDGAITLINAAARRVMGSTEAARPRPLWELAALSAESASIRSAFAPFKPEVLPSGMLFHLVCQGSDGALTSRVVDWDVRVIDVGSGEPLIVLAGIDVSERMAVERQLRESEELHRRVLDRLPAVVWTTDKDLRFTFSAGGALKALGLAPGQVSMAGTSLFNYFHTEDRTHPGIAPHLRALEGESSLYEIEWLDHLFQSRVEPLRDRSQAVIGTIGLAVDITEQTRTAKALKASEAHLRRLVDANVIGVIFWEENGRVTDANQAFLQMVGFSREDLLAGAVSWRALTSSRDRLREDRAIAEIRATGRCAPFEKYYVAKDGTPIPVLVGAASFEGGDAPMVGVAFIVDLREQFKLREARDQLLLQEQRARIETELANARLLLLVEGSKRLARTLNPTDTLQTLAALTVPGLADWSYVIHRGWNGGASMVASAHGDPNRSALLRQLHHCQPDPTSAEGAPKVFRTGRLAKYDDVTPEQLMPEAPGGPVVGTRNPEYLGILRELGMRSFVCVPITGRGGSVDGVLMLVSASDPYRYVGRTWCWRATWPAAPP
jgi:PAS domain S-box-containing protein